MCYCEKHRWEILRDIENKSLPDEALTNICCWKTICSAKSRNQDVIDSDTWSTICTQRGYLLRRLNARGY
jgi:hypothetical protein